MIIVEVHTIPQAQICASSIKDEFETSVSESTLSVPVKVQVAIRFR